MKTILTILFSFMLIVNTGYSQNFEWAENSSTYSVANDGAGNVYTNWATSDFITGNIFIKKQDPSGNILLNITAAVYDPNTGSCSTNDIVSDINSEIYISGTYNGIVNFGSFTLTSVGFAQNTYVAKYNSAGVCVWANSVEVLGAYIGNNTLATDNLGNCYLTGSFENTITIGSKIVTSRGDQDVFLAKLLPNGTCEWARSGGSPAYDYYGGVIVDASGDIVISGNSISNLARFDGGPQLSIVNSFLTNIYYVKYDANGNYLMGKMENFRNCEGLGADNYSNTYMITDGQLSKHDNTGNLVWTTNWTSGIGREFKTDKDGNTYVCGNYMGTATLDLTINNSGDEDVFVAKVDINKTVQWLTSAGGINHDIVWDISADNSGNAYLVGEYFLETTIGATTLYGETSNFLAKVSSTLPVNLLHLKYKLQAMYPVPDMIQINLRSAASPYAVMESVSTLTTLEATHFSSDAQFMNIQRGNSYYIEVEHRNSISTWSASPVLFSGSETTYDFTTSLTKAFGKNMIDVNGVSSFYSGDVNQDGVVDLLDLNEILDSVNNFALGYLNTDLDGNEIVDLNDLTIAYNNSKAFVKVIRP